MNLSNYESSAEQTHNEKSRRWSRSRIYLMISYSYKEKHKMVVESRLRKLDESGRNRIK